MLEVIILEHPSLGDYHFWGESYAQNTDWCLDLNFPNFRIAFDCFLNLNIPDMAYLQQAVHALGNQLHFFRYLSMTLMVLWTQFPKFIIPYSSYLLL